jgi:hypothetical protein
MMVGDETTKTYVIEYDGDVEELKSLFKYIHDKLEIYPELLGSIADDIAKSWVVKLDEE